MGLLRGGVLIHADQVAVFQDGEGVSSDLGQICTDKQGRLREGPQSELRAFFLRAQSSGAHSQEIGVVEPSRGLARGIVIVYLKRSSNIFPSIKYFLGGSP